MTTSKHSMGKEALGLLGEERDYTTKKLQNLVRGMCKELKMLIKKGQYIKLEKENFAPRITLSHDVEFNTLARTPRAWANMQIGWPLEARRK